MYRSAFKSALRMPAARYMSTARPAAVSRTKLAVGASVVASSLLLLPFAVVGNDTNKEKLEHDKIAAQPTEVTHNDTPKPAETPVETSEPTAEADATPGSEPEAEVAEDDHQSAAFNPETGEINWDCPCLGGMADGPCGEEFKAAFACFVYSETEPKGIDCITKFEAMRTCFKQHPEHYKAELYEDDVEPVEPSEETFIDEETVVDVVTAELA